MNENILAYLVVYLIASIPFGMVLAKIFCGVNLREHGSGSIGATNVLRVIKEKEPKKAKKLAILTVIFDSLKGFVPIIIARFIGFDENVLWMMGVLAVVGHCFSIFLWFDGGKGVATGYGVFAAFLPIEFIISLFVWFFAGKILKISSLASLIGVLSFVILSFIIHPNLTSINTHAPIFFISFIIFYKHIPNIKRLILKQEARVI
ncbi:glycerol-3-phosphate 1-O-acyltransferase PlsY [Campylobacter sp. FMV-PI01]|uniref:Glycerol-3-phosphate acyltransferase n=1 Tax=Campylobacter portucalensis TaxID=2608384 RepID=A0A6L5WH37_9BACT|nr:glycerol-3-phosphate 1-O-acyltransferase PlsY [Campylobacter portucalensis]MSN96166.1 glycerol-3-phosphate 1-O-acyltransferase PlsY [Campylobacter portucalensis]